MALIALAAGPGASAAAREADYRAEVERLFERWVEGVRADAEARGISRTTFETAMQGVTLDWALPDLAWPDLGPEGPPAPKRDEPEKSQPEFDQPGRYFPPRHIDQLVQAGRAQLAAWTETLAAVEKAYGVEKNVILAVWGRETAFGKAKIPHYTVQALATQAFMGRRKDFFRDELLLAFRILEERHVTRANMRSSWAGAMGHTQFLPSHFQRYAVDFDGDGRRDIWSTIPDALASTANFLRQQGWETGKTWGYEVRLPKDFDCTLEGAKHQRPIGEWVKLGITRTLDRAFRDDRLGEQAYLVAPGGVRGPAFLVMKNFAVLKTYNNADLYALFVGHVADRINHNRTFEGRWPKLASFTREEVKVLQQWLAGQGIEVGKIDGLIGAMTRVAVGAYQRASGQTPDCYPDRAMLAQAKTAIASN